MGSAIFGKKQQCGDSQTRITALYYLRLFARRYLHCARYLRTAIRVAARPDALRSAASAQSQVGGTDEAGVLAGG
uniref:hypothetical protein n=1 Tax=Bifidobacterium longum TaxID=216816 RepID=UPI0040287FBF